MSHEEFTSSCDMPLLKEYLKCHPTLGWAWFFTRLKSGNYFILSRANLYHASSAVAVNRMSFPLERIFVVLQSDHPVWSMLRTCY